VPLDEINGWRRKTIGRYGFLTYCKKCHAKRQRQRVNEFKRQAVEYKGGKCQLCGYQKCLSALEFHHRDSEEKEFGLSSGKYTIITPKIKRELDKCDLVCSNCHRELHESQDESS
jgi:hypothetical protein